MIEDTFPKLNNINVSRDNRPAYLQYITYHTYEQTKEITNELNPDIQKELLKKLLNFSEQVDDLTIKIDEETELERTRRLGWIVQARAIDLLSNVGLKGDRQRNLWKRLLALEILNERQENNPPSLPGIRTSFREPYKGFIDNYSHNRIIIELKVQEGIWGTLHIGTHISDLFLDTQNLNYILKLIENYEAMTENPLIWSACFIDELVLLTMKLKDNDSEVSFRQIKKRLDFLRELITINDRVKQNLEVEYVLEEKEYPAFLIRLKKKSDPNSEEYFNSTLKLQPEELTNDYWNFLKSLSINSDYIPDRENILSKKLLPKRNTFSKDLNDEWGGRRKPKRNN